MAIYEIAEIKFNISPKSEYTKKLFCPFSVNQDSYDCEITVTKADIEYEKSLTGIRNFGAFESTAILRKICKLLIEQYNGIMLHSAAIKYKDKAYLFTAPSGTGKTTHINLWKKYYDKEVEIINGDKPFLRNVQDKTVVYGNPWNGKENLGSNISAILGGIIILERGVQNSIVRLSSLEALTMLIHQTPLFCENDNINKLLDWFDKTLSNVPVYLLKCNISEEAVNVVKSCIENAD